MLRQTWKDDSEVPEQFKALWAVKQEEPPKPATAGGKFKAAQAAAAKADGKVRRIMEEQKSLQAKLNKAIENRFAGHHKPDFTIIFREAADAENEASSDPTLLGASFYDWVIEDT